MDDESDIYKINKEKLDELNIEEININNNIICLSRFLSRFVYQDCLSNLQHLLKK